MVAIALALAIVTKAMKRTKLRFMVAPQSVALLNLDGVCDKHKVDTFQEICLVAKHKSGTV